MNKYALLTVAAIPGQGSGTSAFKAPEVWKGGGPDEGDEEDQSEGPPSDDPYVSVKAAYAKFGREAIEVKFRDDEPWHAWKGGKPQWNAPASNYRVVEKYRENI